MTLLETHFKKFESNLPKFQAFNNEIEEKVQTKTKELEKAKINDFWADCVTLTVDKQKVNWDLQNVPLKYFDSTNSFEIVDDSYETVVRKVTVTSTQSADFNLLEFSDFDLHKPSVCMIACKNC